LLIFISIVSSTLLVKVIIFNNYILFLFLIFLNKRDEEAKL
jgi:hypothetical protein